MFGYVPRPGDLVVDVGAGSGLETLPFSRRVASAGRVIAIEAHPLMFRCLEDVRRLNSLSNYQTDTTIIERGVPVPGRTLDSIVDSLRIERIDLLKMNIEGAERAALDGMRRTIEITRHVAIGCHDFLADWGRGEMMRTRQIVEAFLRQHGFEVTLREDSREWIRDTVDGRRLPAPGTQ